MDSKKPSQQGLDAAKAVMKRMLATPPTPHEVVSGNGKQKRRKPKGAKGKP
jgi:hypothetical protein